MPGYAGTCGYSHTTDRRIVPAYTGINQMRCTAYKVVPEDGLIQSETCRAYSGNKAQSQEFCAYCRFIYILSVSNYQHTLRNNQGERKPSRCTEWAEFVRHTHVLVYVH